MTRTSTAERLAALRAAPLFAGLSDRSLRRVLLVAKDFEAPAGQVLIEARREASGLFVIEEGTVVIEAGRHRLERGAGEIVGELALLTAEARTARVRAKTDVRGLAIARRDFRALVEEDPKIALAILEVLARRLAETTRTA